MLLTYVVNFSFLDGVKRARKHEHETIEKGEHIDWEILEEQVKKYFNKIEEKSLVHMTALRVSEPVHVLWHWCLHDILL